MSDTPPTKSKPTAQQLANMPFVAALRHIQGSTTHEVAGHVDALAETGKYQAAGLIAFIGMAFGAVSPMIPEVPVEGA